MDHILESIDFVRFYDANIWIICCVWISGHDEKAIIEAKAEDIVRTERMAAEVEFMKKVKEIKNQ